MKDCFIPKSLYKVFTGHKSEEKIMQFEEKVMIILQKDHYKKNSYAPCFCKTEIPISFQ